MVFFLGVVKKTSLLIEIMHCVGSFVREVCFVDFSEGILFKATWTGMLNALEI